MAGAVEGQGYGLQVAEVLLHFGWVVVGAAAVGAGYQDHHGFGGHSVPFLVLHVYA